MSTPEESTAVESGDQATPVVPTQDQAPASEQPGGSIYESEESLKREVERLSSVSNSGDPVEMAKALEGLSDIERYLEKKRSVPEAPAAPAAPAAPPTGKKFTVDWQSKKHEFTDDDGLLGHGNTGRLKAAHLKLKLASEERERELTERLRAAEDKLRQVPATPTPPAIPATPAAPATSVSRPIPPVAPKLSTTDPSLYTDADVAALSAFTEATGKFNNDLVGYLAHIEERTGKTDPSVLAELETLRKWKTENEPVLKQTREENERLANEKADREHWQKFVDFQHKHSSFSTPLAPDKMDAAMQKWMDKIAQANGISENDVPRRAEIVGKYLNGDETVLKNSEGLEPPEGYQAFFKMLELVSKRKAYIGAKILADNSTLEDTYLRMKADSGDLNADIEAIRTSERAAATEAFASGIQQIQQQAGGIDPSKSAGGVDINELGFSAQDMKWFSGVSANPDNLLTLQAKDPQGFMKWEAMAAAIEKKYLR